MKLNYLFIFLSALAWVSCKKDFQVDNNDKNFPLELRTTSIGELTTFLWDEVKVSGFEQYVLVRSATSIPIGANPSANQKVFESTNYEETSSEDSQFFVFDTLSYYRLYAKVNGRWLESNEVQITTSSLVFEGIPQSSIFHPDSNWVIIMKTESLVLLSGTWSYLTLLMAERTPPLFLFRLVRSNKLPCASRRLIMARRSCTQPRRAVFAGLVYPN